MTENDVIWTFDPDLRRSKTTYRGYMLAVYYVGYIDGWAWRLLVNHISVPMLYVNEASAMIEAINHIDRLFELDRPKGRVLDLTDWGP